MGMGLWLMKGLEGSKMDYDFPATDVAMAQMIVVVFAVVSIVWLWWWEKLPPKVKP